MNRFMTFLLLTTTGHALAGDNKPASCMDFDHKKYQCESAYKNHINKDAPTTQPLECRYIDGECFDIFIEKSSECKLIKLKERCEDAKGLYDVACEWDKREKKCEAPSRDNSHDCKRGEWYDPVFGCYDKQGDCKQYNFTNADVCETRKDRLKCSYNQATKICSPRS